jgi:Spy/CpxP family protein refolding chaperone
MNATPRPARLVLGLVLLLAAAWPLAVEARLTRDDCPLVDDDRQPPKSSSTKWWSSDEGKAEFAISEAQSRELEAVFQGVLPTLRQNKADVDQRQQVLSKLLSEASAKEAVVLKAIDELEAAQSALSRTRTIMLYRMYRLLRPEQRAKVQQYYERKAKEHDGKSSSR